ncbi:MAG: hypothetical protein ACLQBY_14525 [Solirubrobacteraceae bacterium]
MLAALAVAAVAAATASAEAPEFGRCIKKAGKPSGTGFKDAACTKAASAKAHYEWVPGPGPKAKFSSTGRIVYGEKYKLCSRGLFEEEVAAKDREKGFIAEAELHEQAASDFFARASATKAECETIVEEETAKSTAIIATGTGVKLKCAGVAAQGEYSGPKTVANLTMRFTECSLKNGAECTSPGAEEGEIVTATLDGELGVIGKFITKKKKHTLTLIGVDAFPAAPGTVVTEFSCAGASFTVSGSVIREVNTNAMHATEPGGYSQSGGVQYPEGFEGLPADVLTSTITEGGVETGPLQTGLATRATLTNEEPIEISTTL